MTTNSPRGSHVLDARETWDTPFLLFAPDLSLWTSASQRAVGFVMEVWFLSVGIGNWLAGKAGTPPKRWGTGFGATDLVLLIRPTKRLMSGAA